MKRFLVAISLAVLAGAGPGSNVGKPIQSGRLTVFPVFGARSGPDARYLTLDEGLQAGLVSVDEAGRMVRRGPMAGGGASVNQLALTNRADRPLMLLAGEIVSGGKQDRVVGQDRVVPPHSDVPLGVFCVEPGRWTGASLEFGAAKLMAHPELRKQALVTKDQQQVWNEVANGRNYMAANAPPAMRAEVMTGSSYAKSADTMAMRQVLETAASSLLPQIPDDAVGVVVAVDNRIVWADVFPSAALFRRYRVKLLQSYVVESYRGIGGGRALTADDAASFLRDVSGHQTIEVEPGIYRLVRYEAGGTITYQLEEPGGQPLHFARMTR